MTAVRGLQIDGYGVVLPSRRVTFGSVTRYRADAPSQHLGMLVEAAGKALSAAGVGPDDIDCVLGATASDVQPIPCTAALVQEQVAPDARCAALDVNSTCTSFITALDVASRYLRDGDYRRILIVSGDVGAQFLNPEQKESYELFSDAAVAVVVSTPSEPGVGVVASLQQTWPRHAHETELRGGGSRYPARDYTPETDHDHRFDMNGRAVLLSASRVLPAFFDRFFERAEVSIDEIDYVIPHQASRALPLIMRRIGIPEGRYANYVEDFGNMVSASVPFALARSLDEGRIGPGSRVLLCGTAAGLTANALLLQL
ncbi:hypothetical protein BW730_00405 [Tessaracoccus aquimaris]|uniref:3-oxoacyl-ACP synthase n=1 Tax=Tessaracoccus aquimaris TaxID=1332264 RepID=A0A1Q2CJI7_9ACTN|nr:3-oxoacyl-[acyl-carrier-protein] synthase III C-terminal domain-containing protein [Tessaracoccus aquimaris]AQP46264.1 hypothetical protein BW730_00405 [Tessaracoccus aquimaris]